MCSTANIIDMIIKWQKVSLFPKIELKSCIPSLLLWAATTLLFFALTSGCFGPFLLYTNGSCNFLCLGKVPESPDHSGDSWKMADHGDCPLTVLYQIVCRLGEILWHKASFQSVDSRHDQPFFMSRRSDPATLVLESPEWSGNSGFRVAGVIRLIWF